MFIRIDVALINCDQIRNACLCVPEDHPDGIPEGSVAILVAGERCLYWPGDSVGGLALKWFFTEATPDQLADASGGRRPLALDVVALYRRQPQL